MGYSCSPTWHKKKGYKKFAQSPSSTTANACADEQDVNLPQTSLIGFAWGIADAQSCREHCGNNHPEATHFTWFDYRTNHQLAGATKHKCNCKKDVTTKKDEVGAVSGAVYCGK